MLNFEKIKLNTHLDEVGFKYGLVRETNESIENYRDRLYKYIKENYKKDKDSFYRSLGYITSLKQIPLCNIDKNTSENLRIVISSSIFYLYKNDALFYKEKLSELKFFKNLIQILESFDFINLIKYSDEYDYYKVENLLPLDTDRTRLRYSVLQQVEKLPKKHIKEVYDYEGDFTNRVFGEDQVINESNYYIDGNILHKYKIAPEEISFDYEEFPVDLVWSPIKAAFVNEDDFNYLIKESIVDNEIFGLDFSQEEKPTEKLLSQDGSVIINNILKKQNTYWGR